MNIENEILDISGFKLESSSEIQKIIANIENLKKENILVHIVSFMHNTVLVQNLKNELNKLFPDAKIVLLKHDEKTNTRLIIYSLKKR